MLNHKGQALVGGLVLMAAMATTTIAGAVGGPKGGSDCVRSHGSDVYSIRFSAGELAMVYVSGDGDTDLDLFVFDGCGRLVASDQDLTDECLVTFVPRATGSYRIEIRNLGTVYNCYTIKTN